MTMGKWREFFWPGLEVRSAVPELMDDFTTDARALRDTLRQFPLVNRAFSRFRALFRAIILSDILKRKQKSVTILDIGAGGCDIPLWIAGELRSLKIEPTLFCLDHDPRVIAYARERVRGHPAITLLETDIREAASLNLRPHYIVGNHVLHHFPSGIIPEIIRSLNETAAQGILINDLLRSRWAFLGFTLLGRPLFRKGFAFHDGRLSIRKGFRPVDFEEYLLRAGLAGRLHVKTVFPGHVCLWGIKP